MGNKADLRRRWLGGIFLGGAILMLIAGETVLSRRLSESAWLMVVYWLLCFLSVVCAMIIALLDLAVLRRRTRENNAGCFPRR